MLLVTGASGYVGGAALRLLAQRLGAAAVAGLVRDPARAQAPPGVALRLADYDDRAALQRAFAGVERLVCVASDGDARQVLRHHANLIDAAAAAGVGRIVFLGIVDCAADSPFYYAPVYRDAEARLAAAGPAWTILRAGLYADLVLSHWLEPALAGGELALPVAAARIAPVARDDVAVALAAAALGPHEGRRYTLSGPRAWSFAEIAAAASRASGRPLVYRPCSRADYLAHCWATMQDPWPHAFTTLCASIVEGRYVAVSDGVQALTGRAPEDFDAFLARRLG